MRKDRVSINELLANPEENRNWCWNFYDWFCSDGGLEGRFFNLIPKLKFLVKEGLIDGDKHYVWFKNNCPCDGNLYDDIRISTLDKGNEFKGGFCPKSGHNSDTKKCSVWFFNQNNDIEEITFDNWLSFKREVKSNTVLREKITSHFAA